MKAAPHPFVTLGSTLAVLYACQSHTQNSRLLAPGESPPDLSGTDQQGKPHHLAESRGQYTVVYFYPKDDTPGCTKEACAFRDIWNRYREANVALYGVSVDNTESHDGFARKYSIPFPILSDTAAQWTAAFGVKLVNGKAARVSFLLSPDGKVQKVYDNVDPGVHAAQVLADITGHSL